METTKKVLVVEDSQVQAQMLQKLLEPYGVRVLCAPDGKVGVELAESWLPDVVILDIKMPRMDGFEVCQRLRDSPKTNHIPVVMLSMYNEQSKLKQSVYLGAVDFIPKDEFANVVLLETLHQLHILDKNRIKTVPEVHW
ncbi:MAG: response regulator [Anaerolineae bacterium]|nr:response regulator [Anaerolineae bacterium]